MFVSIARRTCVVALASMFVLVALARPASASPILIGNITILEQDNLGAPLTDTRAIGLGPELAEGDGSNIGNGIFLTGEFIDVGPASILFSIFGGGSTEGPAGYFDTGFTTYDYTFSGFAFDTPGHISAFSFTSPDGRVTSFSNANIDLSTPGSIVVHLGGIGILTSQTNLGQLRLDLTIASDVTTGPSPVPEPASLTLFGTGLAAAYWRKRRSRSTVARS